MSNVVETNEVSTVPASADVVKGTATKEAVNISAIEEIGVVKIAEGVSSVATIVGLLNSEETKEEDVAAEEVSVDAEVCTLSVGVTVKDGATEAVTEVVTEEMDGVIEIVSNVA